MTNALDPLYEPVVPLQDCCGAEVPTHTSDCPLTAYAQRAKPATDEQKARIEEYRKLLQGSRDGTGERDMSYGELADLQSLADEGVIDPSDTEMLEAAGVSEWEATGYGEGNPEDEDADPMLHCDLCDKVEWSGDLTPDWNGETGNHLSCERERDEDGDPEPPEVDPDLLYDAARDEAFSDALDAGEPDNWRDYMPGGSKR